MFRTKSFVIYFLIGVISLTLYSCTPVSKLKYIQREQSQFNDTLKAIVQPYILQKGDNLYIDIKTTNPEMRTLVNGKNNEPLISMSVTPYSLFITTYTIDNEYNIQLPLVGPFHCSGMTSEKLQDSIEKTMRSFITDAIVSIKMANTNFSVLGEVYRPGQYFASQKNINILDAIAMAGDLTAYGNRKNISIVRKIDSDNYKIYSVDITKSSVISNEGFILMPNDIVYIEPMKTKPFGLAVFPYSTVLSTITTVVVIMSFIIKK